MMFVSTTSRTPPVLPPLAAHRVHFRLNLLVTDGQLARTPAV
jgi:hypothetical protein